MDIPNDEYYQNMLRTLDKPIEKKSKKSTVVLESKKDKYDKSSPMFYLFSSRALSVIESQIQADKQLEKSKLEATREEERARVLSEKQARASRPNSNKGMMQSILAMKISSSSGRERLLEEEMLRPYRKDPRNVKNLFDHCHNIIQEKNRLIEEKRLKIPKTHEVNVPLSNEERQESARQRREEFEKEYLDRLEVMINEKSDKQKLYVIVQSSRNLKEQDKVKWNACVKIQRLWRKRRGKRVKDREREVGKISQKLRASLQDHDKRLQVFKTRTVSSNLIVQFLKDTRTKASIRRMFRVVKYLQHLARSMREIDLARVQLLGLYMERLMLPFAAHVSIVANNRGLDLHNLTNFETNQLKAQAHLVKNFRLLASMQTPEFHAYLRRRISKLSDFQRDFIVTNKVWNEKTILKQKLLLKLLTKKRRDFLKELLKPTPMTYAIAPIDMEEIQAFILGGADPLTPRFQAFEEKHITWHRESLRPKTPFRCADEKKKSQFVPPRFYMLSNLQPMDIADFFIEFSAVYREEKRQAITAAKLAAISNIENMSSSSAATSSLAFNLKTFSSDSADNVPFPSSASDPQKEASSSLFSPTVRFGNNNNNNNSSSSSSSHYNSSNNNAALWSSAIDNAGFLSTSNSSQLAHSQRVSLQLQQQYDKHQVLRPSSSSALAHKHGLLLATAAGYSSNMNTNHHNHGSSSNTSSNSSSNTSSNIASHRVYSQQQTPQQQTPSMPSMRAAMPPPTADRKKSSASLLQSHRRIV